ncbi:hypothetical protein MMC12_006176 [Toensbergia leucococca]|nr:hypothetical protein [Toensbergia leucococca]
MSSTAPTFLTLPAEIRLRIYCLLVCRPKDPAEIFVSRHHFYGFNTAILGTNKQIHAEAHYFFYEERTWSLVDPLMRHWDSLPRHPVYRHIKKIHLRIDLYERLIMQLFHQSVARVCTYRRSLDGTYKALSAIPTLRSLRISWFDHAPFIRGLAEDQPAGDPDGGRPVWYALCLEHWETTQAIIWAVTRPLAALPLWYNPVHDIARLATEGTRITSGTNSSMSAGLGSLETEVIRCLKDVWMERERHRAEIEACCY